jgi:hypothetical protein
MKNKSSLIIHNSKLGEAVRRAKPEIVNQYMEA